MSAVNRFFKQILLVLCLVLLWGASPVDIARAAETYQQIRADYQTLVKSAQLQRQRVNWEKIINRLERIETTRLGDSADDVTFLKAKTWHGLAFASGSKDDFSRAREAYRAVASRFPGSNLADDALFRAAELSQDVFAETVTARQLYQSIVDNYPTADMHARARERLTRLGGPLEVAAPKTEPVDDSSTLQNIRYWSGPDSTRTVLDLSNSVRFQANQLGGKRPRVYVDLWGAEANASIAAKISVEDGLLQQIRTSRFDGERLRVVFDLYDLSDYKIFFLEDPYRLVVDVQGKRLPAAKGKTPEMRSLPDHRDDSIAGILEQAPSSDLPVLHIPQHQQNEGIKLIVVDAGHGGRDPGAVGPNKILEKNITLKMAKYLADKLRKELKCEVRLTRTDDRYLKLRDRTAFANKVGADLFISLHANASASRKAYGVETYFLNLSKNNQAAAVAARENGTSLEEVGHLEAILFDLMANAKINESSRLASEVQQALISGLKPHYSYIRDLGVRQGPFHVLLGATMPSVLVESAFISNRREEKRLNSSAYQKRVANAIVTGVKRYVETLEQVAHR
ncbi:MAG: hypothetical protein C0618_09270 [Desulfuromonas sp.]|nr:MAG: hypothetical protein C0618_09270 [Desulfuromonas sp.]